MALTAPASAAPTLREPMLPRPFRLASKQSETFDTVTIEFEVTDDGPPLAFLPGQFTMLYIFGVGEVPISVSGDPAHPERLVLTVRAVGAVTNAICALNPGEIVGIRGPFGTGWPLTEGKDLVIV
ncbi:MAG: FAD-binding oxidoreductase, partial [Actinomycetota bacterium]|nr:FAD-binding oxidoreductase [Actinomycetota bacterium]